MDVVILLNFKSFPIIEYFACVSVYKDLGNDWTDYNTVFGEAY